MIENHENMSVHNQEVTKTKKFVFQLYSDNIDFVETLSYQEKNDLINELLDNYKETTVQGKNFKNNMSAAKKAALILLGLVVGIPLIIYLISVSFELTKTSYTNMQSNFEKLF